MPRKKYIATSEFPYHVSARCNNRDWFSIPMDSVWRIFEEHLYFIRHAYDLQIFCFVLMNNHYHMILQTPSANLAAAMNFFQSNVSRAIGREAGRINRIFGGPYSWSVISNLPYFLNAYKYVYRNPIEAGLCFRAEHYEYSTLPGLLGFQHLLIPVEEDLTLFSDIDGTLSWLNASFPTAEVRDAVGRGFKRPVFKIPKKFQVPGTPEIGPGFQYA